MFRSRYGNVYAGDDKWREMMEDPATKIGRPRQIYIGETERDYPSA